MHSRLEWTTHKPAFSPAKRGVGDIFFHHEGGGRRGIPKDKAAALREIEAYVLSHGYIAIDYNVAVFQDGDVWAGRGVQNEDGATIHNNPTSVSVVFIGNFEIEAAPDAMIWGAWSAIHEIVDSGYSDSTPNIRLHDEVFDTKCPGKNVIARHQDLKNWNQVPKPEPTPANNAGGELMHFIQIKGATPQKPQPVAGSNGQTKNVYGNGDQYKTAVWCAAVEGSKNPETIIPVSKEYWDSLPTVG